MSRGRRRRDRRTTEGKPSTSGTGEVPSEALKAFAALAKAIEVGRPGTVHHMIHPKSGLALSLEGWQIEGMIAEGSLKLIGLAGPGWEGGAVAEGVTLSSDGERVLLELSPARPWAVRDQPLGSVVCMARGESGRWLYLWSRTDSPSEVDQLDLEAGQAPVGPNLAFEGYDLDHGHDCIGLVREWPSGRRSVLQCLTCPDHGFFGHIVYVRISSAAMDELIEVERSLRGGVEEFQEVLGKHLIARANHGHGPPPLLEQALRAFDVDPPEGPWGRLKACVEGMARRFVDLHVVLEGEPRVGMPVVIQGDRTLGEVMVTIAGAFGLPHHPVGWATRRRSEGSDHGQQLCPPLSLPVGSFATGTVLALDFMREGREEVTFLAGLGRHPHGDGNRVQAHETCGDCEVMRPASGYCLDCGAWLCGRHVWEHIAADGHTTVSVPRPDGGRSPPPER